MGKSRIRILDEPNKTTTYIQQVITPEFAEIDETIVYVDTIPTVAFGPQMQLDSSVLFENYTEPTDGSNCYTWDFGDGSGTSHETNPYHTFPAFDTLFNVCLTATNDCGNYTWCDTVYKDSAHWGGEMRMEFGEREAASGQKPAARGLEREIEAFVYPNPTEGYSTLVYRIQEDAQLSITDAMGKLIWQTALSPASSQRPDASGQQQIPSKSFAPGMYYYTLQTNTAGVRGKLIVK